MSVIKLHYPVVKIRYNTNTKVSSIRQLFLNFGCIVYNVYTLKLQPKLVQILNAYVLFDVLLTIYKKSFFNFELDKNNAKVEFAHRSGHIRPSPAYMKTSIG